MNGASQYNLLLEKVHSITAIIKASEPKPEGEDHPPRNTSTRVLQL